MIDPIRASLFLETLFTAVQRSAQQKSLQDHYRSECAKQKADDHSASISMALTVTRTAGAYVIFQEVANVPISDDSLLLSVDNSSHRAERNSLKVSIVKE